MRLRYNAHVGGGSHLPMLMRCLGLTDGPVLELGMGLFSTPYLHWACYGPRRRLVSCESKQHFMDMFVFDDPREKGNDYSYHQVIFVEDNDWDRVDVESEHWGVVLIDHHPGPRRKEEMRRVAGNADYVVVHDTQEEADWHYKYSQYFGLYKYRYDTLIFPRTSVFSNFKDLTGL